MQGSTSLRRGGWFLFSFFFLSAFWVLISFWICPQRHKAVFGKRQLRLPNPFVMPGQLGLKAQTAAHPWGRAALLLLNCFKVPVCDMKHAVKWIYSRCPCKFPSALPSTWRWLTRQGSSVPAASLAAWRSGMVAHLGLQFGGVTITRPGGCPQVLPSAVWGEESSQWGPRGWLASLGLGKGCVSPSWGFGGILILVAGGHLSPWKVSILRLGDLHPWSLGNLHPQGCEGPWVLGIHILRVRGIPVLGVRRTAILDVWGSPSLESGDLHPQGWGNPPTWG